MLENTYSKTLSVISVLYSSLEKKRKFHLFYLLLLMILGAFAEVLSVVSFLPFVTVLTNSENIFESDFVLNNFPDLLISIEDNFVFVFTSFFAFTILLAGFIRIATIFFIQRTAANVGTDFMNKCLSSIYYRPYKNFIEKNSSDTVHLSAIQIDDAIFVVSNFLQLLTNLILFIFLLATMLLVNSSLTIVSIIIFVSIYLSMVFRFRSNLYQYSIQVDQIRKSQIKLLTEMNGSIRDIILSNSQNKFLFNLISRDKIMRRKNANSIFLGSFPKPLIESLAIVIFGIFGAILYKSSPNALVIPTVGTLALASQKLIPALQQIYGTWTQIRKYISGAKSVSKIITSPKLESVKSNSRFKDWKLIEFKNVSFAHENGSKKIIDNLNLTINRGETIGIQGKTGSGKSTLADLLSGLLSPSSGLIKISTASKSTKIISNDTSWFKEISYVPQKIFLLDTSIAKNIAFTMEESEIDYELVEKVAKMSRIHDFISRLPKSYNTEVGEQGIKLSGGQQQRIGIARSLYRKSSILIFDEATSSLDYGTEDKIIESISYLSEYKSLTIMIIAHRLNTLEICNSIYKIENGKLYKTDDFGT